MKKYRFTGEEKLHNGVLVKQIASLYELTHAREGDQGGWIQNENNLSHEGECWVADDAIVYGDARISDNAFVNGRAQVSGYASVSDRAWITGESAIFARSSVGGSGVIDGNALVFGEANIRGHYNIGGSATIHGIAEIFGEFFAAGNSDVSGNAIIGGNCRLLGFARIEKQNDIFMSGPFPSGLYTFYRGEIIDFEILVSGGDIIEPTRLEDFILISNDKAAVEAAKIAKTLINPHRPQWEY